VKSPSREIVKSISRLTTLCLTASRIHTFPPSRPEDVTPAEKEIMALRRFVIERDIPKVGTLDREQLKQASAKSNAALAQLAPRIQWVESFVAGDKTFCVYLAEDEAVIRKHAEISGFPATKITAIGKVFDPTTAAS
jgi:hypothetical protein